MKGIATASENATLRNERTSQKEITTTWQVIEVEDKDAMDALHHTRRVAIEINRKKVTETTGTRMRVVSAEIALRAHMLDSQMRYSTVAGGSMGGKYEGFNGGRYKLTNGTMILPERWRGLRIGTYMQNEVLRWAKGEIAQPGKIDFIRLVAGDAMTEAARDRRNRFYEQFGIRIVWSESGNGIEHAEGHSDPELTIEEVHTLDAVNGIRAFDLPGAWYELAYRATNAERRAVEAERARQHSKEWYERDRATWSQARRILIGGLVVLGVALVLALRFR